MSRREWRYMVRCFYADDVRPPKVAGALAIETVHASGFSRDLEVSVAKEREDIGNVVVLCRNQATGGWQ